MKFAFNVKFHLCAQTCIIVIFTFARFKAVCSYNITGAILPPVATGFTSTFVAVLFTCLSSVALLLGISCNILANQNKQNGGTTEQYVKAVNNRYKYVTWATSALPISTYIVTVLFSGAIHNASLWTATNIVIGLAVLSAKYLYNAMQIVVEETEDLTTLYGCYEVMAMCITTRLKLCHVSCRIYEGERYGKLKQKMALYGENAFFKDRNPQIPHVNRPRARGDNSLNADWFNTSLQGTFADSRPGHRHRVDLNEALDKIKEASATFAVPTCTINKVWLVKDLSLQRQITGQALIKNILLFSQKMELHCQEISTAAKDEFMLTSQRYKIVLKEIINKKWLYKGETPWEINDLVVMSVAQLQENVVFANIGWEMTFERHLYRSLAKPIGTHGSSELLTRSIIAILAKQPLPNGNRDISELQFNVASVLPNHLADLWIRYINISLILLDLIKMSRNVDKLKPNSTLPSQYWECLKEEVFVGINLTTVPVDAIHQMQIEASVALYSMSDVQLYQISLITSTIAIMYEILHTKVADMDDAGYDIGIYTIKNAIGLWEQQQYQMFDDYNNLWAHINININSAPGAPRLQMNNNVVNKMYDQLFRMRSKTVVERMFTQLDANVINSIVIKEVVTQWTTDVLSRLGLAVLLSILYASISVYVLNVNYKYKPVIDTSVLSMLTLFEYYYTWSSKIRQILHFPIKHLFARWRNV